MTREEFFTRFNDNAVILQSVAANLTNDKDRAYSLYHETVYQALKALHSISDGRTFRAWLVSIMRQVFLKRFNEFAH